MSCFCYLPCLRKTLHCQLIPMPRHTKNDHANSSTFFQYHNMTSFFSCTRFNTQHVVKHSFKVKLELKCLQLHIFCCANIVNVLFSQTQISINYCQFLLSFKLASTSVATLGKPNSLQASGLTLPTRFFTKYCD